MGGGLGGYLRHLRLRRNVALSAVARDGGVAASTVWRWEEGKVLPRLDELRRALGALGATESEREVALLLFGAPRGVREDRAAHGDGPWLPARGDLLRALRVRAGLTATQVAEQLRVTQATVARWERTRVAPSESTRERLCDLYHAQPEELEALGGGWGFLGEPIAEPCRELPLLENRLRTLVGEVRRDEAKLADLRFLTIQGQLAGAYRCRRPVRALLVTAGTWYADWLSRAGRLAESGRRARQTLRLLERPDSAIGPEWCKCVSLVGLSRMHCGGGSASAARWLTAHIGYVDDRPDLATAFLREMADYCQQGGRYGDGLQLIARAYDAARLAGGGDALKFARHSHSGILVSTRRYAEAAELLPETDNEYPLQHTINLIRRVEVCLGLGEHADAHTALQEAVDLIGRHGFRQFAAHAALLGSEL